MNNANRQPLNVNGRIARSFDDVVKDLASNIADYERNFKARQTLMDKLINSIR